jgi:dihydroflavonol-4-reductase
VGDVLCSVEFLTGVPGPRWLLPFGLTRALGFLSPAYYWITRERPLFITYSLDVISSNCTMSHEKASRELGFFPRPFRETMEDTVRWFRAQRML